MKSSGIGGQAVLEGIMMKNGDRYAVAVRKSDQEIAVDEQEYRSIAKYSWMKVPFLRGIFNFVDSLVIGMKTLTYSASFYEEEEEEGKPSFLERYLSGEQLEHLLTFCSVAFAILLCVAIFMLLPVAVASFFRRFTDSAFAIALLEGLLRIGIFIAYVGLISFMKDIRRTYMYHGAEHKCINCVEHGLPLTVDNVRASSKEHKRCGTSFMLIVMVISIFVFMFIRIDNIALRMLSRVLLVPFIAGVSYEFIRLAGRSENALVNLLSRPGLWLQGLTTKEPDDSMIEVAIAAVERVFDWKAYLTENFGLTFAQTAASVTDLPEDTSSILGGAESAVSTEAGSGGVADDGRGPLLKPAGNAQP